MGNGPWPSLNIVKQSTMSKLMNSSDVCLAQQDHFLLHSSCSVFTPRHCSAALLDTGAGGWSWILWTGLGLYTNLILCILLCISGIARWIPSVILIRSD